MVAAWHGMPAQRSATGAGTHWLRAMGASYARLMREPAFVLNVMVLSLTVGAFYAYLGGAPLVLRSYGIGPATVGFHLMVPPLSYIIGNYLTSRLVRRIGEGRVRVAGQAVTIAGIVLMIGLALAGWRGAWSFTLPLVLLGIGHGLLVPPTLAATVGSIPALAGAGAAIAGVMQQIVGAFGGYAVGWVPLEPVALGCLMLAFTLCAVAAQALIPRPQALPTNTAA
jgi:DHA1 family bicyclomycin/chloramphenicol resistance-like MFS transporter